MSVINQMLNQLEQRGVHTATEQAMVRAVPQTRRSYTLPLLALGLVVIAGVVTWQSMQIRKPDVAADKATKAAQELSHPEGTANSPIINESGKLSPQQSVAAVAPLSAASVASPPASRLSFELSSVPLPSTTRTSDKALAGQSTTVNTSNVVAVQPAEHQPIKTAAENAKVALQVSNGISPMKHISSAQQADAEFRKAAALMQQGRINDALAGYEAALRLDAGHDQARQALVALLLEAKRGTDAERVLQERLNSKPDHTGFTMLLARLQVERGVIAEATATLEKGLPYANAQADYQAFLAALLQRQNRNDEAIAHYQIALQAAPNSGIWLMGYGISLLALQRNADAKDAFKRALDTQTLSPDLQAFVQQKLKGL